MKKRFSLQIKKVHNIDDRQTHFIWTINKKNIHSNSSGVCLKYFTIVINAKLL